VFTHIAPSLSNLPAGRLILAGCRQAFLVLFQPLEAPRYQVWLSYVGWYAEKLGCLVIEMGEDDAEQSSTSQNGLKIT